MDGLGLFLMAGGLTFQGFQKYRQLKNQKKDLKAQAAELDMQAKYVARMSMRSQRDFLEQEDIVLDQQKASTAKAGLRVGSGSAAKRREAISEKYEWQRETTRIQSSEKIRELNARAAMLRKMAKRAGKAAKWGLLSSLLGAGFTAGMGAYQAGMFSSSGGYTAASTGGGAYGGTMGGGPTGGASRSMIW